MIKFHFKMLGFMLLMFARVEGSFNSDKYHEVKPCFNTTVQPETVQTTKVDSQLNCAILCLGAVQCHSFSVSKVLPGACTLNSYLLDDNGCVDWQMDHYNVQTDSPCLNGGTYNSTAAKCRCFHGFIGNICERLMYDCKEGFDSGHYLDLRDVFYIHPPTSSSPIKVLCDMKLGGKLFVMRKSTKFPYVDFNRTWEEYRDGFGDLNSDGNFWLGNEKLFLVSTHGSRKLIIQMATLGTFKQHFYLGFKVSNESSGYGVSFQSNYPNTRENGLHYLNNCMEYQHDMLFTTIDRDNDLNSGGNCAQIHLSGWWYNDCGGCNPTGKLQPKSETHQSSDPTYMSVPVPGDWAADSMQLVLVKM